MKLNKKLRNLLIALACVLVFVGLSLFYLGIGSSTIPVTRSLTGGKDDICLTAHRGYSAVAPENTGAAIEEAGKAGFYAAEFDIMPTADGVWVLHHDDEVDRMSDGTGVLEEMTWEEVSKLRIDNGNGIENYPDLPFTTFEEALAICDKYGMRAMVEVKGGTPEQMASVLEVLNKQNLQTEPLIIDFDADRLAAVRALDADMELWYLKNTISQEVIDFAKQHNTGIAFNFGVAENYKMLDAAKAENITLASWTVDFPPAMDFLVMNGVKYITTNKIHP